MIKIKNKTPIREPLPAFLVGLNTESLADLSWTDPELGVSDCAWWPEIDQSQTLGDWQEYGEETLTPYNEARVVVATRAIVPMSDERKAVVMQEKLQAIGDEMQRKIREKYALEDEQYFARIGVGVALGVYEFQAGEREALLEFGAFVESIRQWGRDERARLAL